MAISANPACRQVAETVRRQAGIRGARPVASFLEINNMYVFFALVILRKILGPKSMSERKHLMILFHNYYLQICSESWIRNQTNRYKMRILRVLRDFAITYIIVFLVSMIVSYFYSLIAYGFGSLDLETSIRFGFIFGIIFPVLRIIEQKGMKR